MSTTTITLTARHLVRAELLIAELRLKQGVRKAAIVMVSAIGLLLSFIMLNIAAYQWLKIDNGPVFAPLILGGVDFALAAIAAFIAMRATSGSELMMAQNMRNMLAQHLDSEVHRTIEHPVTSTLQIAPVVFSALMMFLRIARKGHAAK